MNETGSVPPAPHPPGCLGGADSRACSRSHHHVSGRGVQPSGPTPASKSPGTDLLPCLSALAPAGVRLRFKFLPVGGLVSGHWVCLWLWPIWELAASNPGPLMLSCPHLFSLFSSSNPQPCSPSVFIQGTGQPQAGRWGREQVPHPPLWVNVAHRAKAVLVGVLWPGGQDAIQGNPFLGC